MEKLKEFGKAIVYGRNDYSPAVKKVLEKRGDNVIKKIVINRTPLSSFLKAALNFTTLGDFNTRFKNYPHDELFHLRIDIHTTNGVVSLEKNEAIFMKERPRKSKNAELRTIDTIPQGLTINTLLEKTKTRMGAKFFPYSAKNNNCSDFIMNVLQANDLGTKEDRDFVDQPVKMLFSGYLRKLSNTVTDLAGRANVISQGGDIKSTDSINMDALKKDVLEVIEKHEKAMEGKGVITDLAIHTASDVGSTKAKGKKHFLEKSKKEQKEAIKKSARSTKRAMKKIEDTAKNITSSVGKIFGRGTGRQGRFAKGSQEAKDYMAKLREMRGKK
jgi:hypothetical protein